MRKSLWGLAVMGVLSCGGDSGPFAVVFESPSMQLGTGETATISAHVLSMDGDTLRDAAISWSSSNTSIATVTSGGVVSGVALGTAVITGTSGGAGGSLSLNVVPRTTGRWKGTILSTVQSTLIDISVAETPGGTITGSGTFTIPGTITASVSVTGNHLDSIVKMTWTPTGFQPISYRARFATPDVLQGIINGSGFTNQTVSIARQP